jgi:hypothetical protein
LGFQYDADVTEPQGVARALSRHAIGENADCAPQQGGTQLRSVVEKHGALLWGCDMRGPALEGHATL